jgi:hypothetical protein
MRFVFVIVVIILVTASGKRNELIFRAGND